MAWMQRSKPCAAGISCLSQAQTTAPAGELPAETESGVRVPKADELAAAAASSRKRPKRHPSSIDAPIQLQDRATSAHADSSLDRAMHESMGPLDRTFQREAMRQTGGNG